MAEFVSEDFGEQFVSEDFCEQFVSEDFDEQFVSDDFGEQFITEDFGKQFVSCLSAIFSSTLGDDCLGVFSDGVSEDCEDNRLILAPL